jgi:hypothetical protein
MKRRIILLVAIAFLLLAIGIYISLSYEDRLAKQAVHKIEEFRGKHGRLPNSLAEAGILLPEDREGPVFYEKRRDGSYVVWYGTTLGESVTYDSNDKTWDGE